MKDRIQAEIDEEKATPPIAEESGELGHWIAAPMNKIKPEDDEMTRFNIFHDIVERAEKVITLLREREAAARRNLEIATDTIKSLESIK